MSTHPCMAAHPGKGPGTLRCQQGCHNTKESLSGTSWVWASRSPQGAIESDGGDTVLCWALPLSLMSLRPLEWTLFPLGSQDSNTPGHTQQDIKPMLGGHMDTCTTGT